MVEAQGQAARRLFYAQLPNPLGQATRRLRGYVNTNRRPNKTNIEGKEGGTVPHRQRVSEPRRYCVYNQTRECFLSLNVTVADTTLARLRGMIGRLRLRPDDGIWVVPSSGVHTLGVLVPLDLIYLDSSHRVIHVVEHFPTFRIAPIRSDSESVLELPVHSIYPSQTQVGDQLLICAAEDMEKHFSLTAPAGRDTVMTEV